MGKETEILQKVEKNKPEYLGHIMINTTDFARKHSRQELHGRKKDTVAEESPFMVRHLKKKIIFGASNINQVNLS